MHCVEFMESLNCTCACVRAIQLTNHSNVSGRGANGASFRTGGFGGIDASLNGSDNRAKLDNSYGQRGSSADDSTSSVPSGVLNNSDSGILSETNRKKVQNAKRRTLINGRERGSVLEMGVDEYTSSNKIVRHVPNVSLGFFIWIFLGEVLAWLLQFRF